MDLLPLVAVCTLLGIIVGLAIYIVQSSKHQKQQVSADDDLEVQQSPQATVSALAAVDSKLSSIIQPRHTRHIANAIPILLTCP
jgi:hypothetical protein